VNRINSGGIHEEFDNLEGNYNHQED